MMGKSALLASVRLGCPECGREIVLRAAEDLPAGLDCLVVPCPDCEGHHLQGRAASTQLHGWHALPLDSTRLAGIGTSMTKEARG